MTRDRFYSPAADLLEALQDVLEYAERYADLNDEPQEGGCHKAIQNARDAIKRATTR